MHYAKRLAILLLAGTLLGLSLVAYKAQHHYAEYAPPGTQIGPIHFAAQFKRADAAQTLAIEAAKLRLQLQFADQTRSYKLSEAGVSYDWEAAASEIKLQSRQILFSRLLSKPQPIALPAKIDKAKLTQFAQNLAQANSQSATRAKFTLTGQNVQVQPGISATTYDADKIASAIRSALSAGSLTARLTPNRKSSAAPNTPSQLAAAQKALQAMINVPATIVVEGKSYTASPSERFSWILINETPGGDISLTVDGSRVSDYVSHLAAQCYRAPGITTVTLLDGAEVGRQAGPPGASLPVGAVAAQIKNRLETGNPESIPVALTSLAPTIKYQRTYSRTANGFSHLIQDFAAEHRGTYGIVLTDLSGPLNASYNSNKSFVTASVFKAFLAYAVLDKVDTGEYTMTTPTPDGINTVDTALYKMIHFSDNNTAYALHQLYGFTNIDPFLHAQGFPATTLNNYDAEGRVISQKITTPADVASLFARLQSGSLLSTGTTSYLINLMENQVYRQGIPQGSAPSVVADKVGFLGSYIHDAGIVYSPRGTYVLVVLTNGGNWADIAELSRRIHALYNS